MYREAARLEKDRADQCRPEEASTPAIDNDLDRLDARQRLAAARYLDRLQSS